MKNDSTEQNRRHILGLSGGKDSSALAVYMRDKVPDMEYAFCDTGKELPETYEFLDRLEAFLGKKVERLNAEREFDHWLSVFGGLLPSAQVRWCTRLLKIKPFEEFVGDDLAYNYVAIRADEDRVGYKPLKTVALRNIEPKYPFKEDGITETDVYRILEESGLGLPEYYKWRTRSGCYFCFYQRKAEWVGLMENHSDLFELAKGYEKFNEETGERFTWSQGESLVELSDTERIKQIKENYRKAIERTKASQPNRRLLEIFGDVLDDEDNEEPCLICHK
ncbi:MAG: phosphoadenosine phosphosulfate reductase family protein [Candidatus Poribacteria bacterium]|nr:phosphoadenosine phosphosulfate reductase family protein [Candidatus Poribacteria bacterium]